MSAKGIVKPRVADIIKSGFSNLSEGFKALFGSLREVDVPDDEELGTFGRNFNAYRAVSKKHPDLMDLLLKFPRKFLLIRQTSYYKINLKHNNIWI